MARCPFAIWLPLPENAKQPLIEATQAIAHTAVDAPGDTDLRRYFARLDIGAESHFWVTWNGTIVQMMDTARMANANRLADVRAISIETEDDGRIVPWSDDQVRSLIRLFDWICDTHPVPRRLCPGWDQPGIGWHSMFGFKDPLTQESAVDNPWSLYRGKVCPGKPRIYQLRNAILPALTATPPTPLPKDLTMDQLLILYIDLAYEANAQRLNAITPGTVTDVKGYDAGGRLYWLKVAKKQVLAGQTWPPALDDMCRLMGLPPQLWEF